MFISCFYNPTSTCTMENWRKHNSGKQPTVDCTQEPIQHSSIKHKRSFYIRTWAGRKYPCKLGLSTPWYFKLQWMSCSSSGWMSCSCSSSICRSRKLTEQTVIRVWINLLQHTRPSNITSITQWQESLIRTNSGAQEADGDIQ